MVFVKPFCKYWVFINMCNSAPVPWSNGIQSFLLISKSWSKAEGKVVLYRLIDIAKELKHSGGGGPQSFVVQL